jgi:hypothetical protein
VALGAMRWRLTLSDANDLQAHFQRIQRLTASAAPVFMRHDTDGGRFLVRTERNGAVWAMENLRAKPATSHRRAAIRKPILPELAAAWSFDGEPRVRVVGGSELPFGSLYGALMDTAPPVHPANLRLSDSGVCFVGRATGELATRVSAATARFRIGHEEADLSQILTVHDWSPSSVSRMTFFNTRTKNADRQHGVPSLVAVDGDAAFQRVTESDDFRQSDIVAVIHRVIDRDRLETVGLKIANLAQWYTTDVEFLAALPRPPRGITVSTLRRRQ